LEASCRLQSRVRLEEVDTVSDAGRRFAYRERARTPGDPARPVELVKEGPPRSQKVRVRWLDGEYEGLDEWVPAVRLVAPWEEAGALLQDGRSMLAALEASGDVHNSVPYRAAELVFFAIPQEAGAEVFFGIRAIERELLVIDDLEAATVRLGLDAEALLSEHLAYVDRSGAYRAPFGVVPLSAFLAPSTRKSLPEGLRRCEGGSDVHQMFGPAQVLREAAGVRTGA
jgi:hypothetical protein